MTWSSAEAAGAITRAMTSAAAPAKAVRLALVHVLLLGVKGGKGALPSA